MTDQFNDETKIANIDGKEYTKFDAQKVLKRLKIIIFVMLLLISYLFFFSKDNMSSKTKQTLISISVGTLMAIVYSIRVQILLNKKMKKRF